MFSSDSEEDEGSPIHQPVKRARPIESIDDDSNQITEEMKEKRITFLQEAFPKKKRRVRLQCSKWSMLSIYVFLKNFEEMLATPKIFFKNPSY